MFQTHSHRQDGIELVNFVDLVLKDHLLRKINSTIDHRLFVHRGKDPTIILRGQRASLRGPGNVVQYVIHWVLYGIAPNGA